MNIVLWDARFQYEVQELARLFEKLRPVEVQIDPWANSKTPVTEPGIVCSLTSYPEGDCLILRCVNGSTEQRNSLCLPLNWKNDRRRTREVRKMLLSQLYQIFQGLSPTPVPWGTLTGVRPVKLAHQLMNRTENFQAMQALLENEYHVAPDKARLLGQIVENQAPFLDRLTQHNQVCLYIHIPFCPSRCRYCSFLSTAVRDPQDPLVLAYLDALYVELSQALRWINDHQKQITALYVGGGTPTLLSAHQLGLLFEWIHRAYSLHQIPEMTVEAGRPDTLTAEKLQILSQFGVNRISINPQTMHDKTLTRVNRGHTVDEFLKAWEMARNYGFQTHNLDLILGLPGESAQDLHETLRWVDRLQPENLTVHTLALKRGAEYRFDASVLTVDGNEAREMMNHVDALILESKWEPYYLYRQKQMAGHLENVGFSMPGHECLYNIAMMEEIQSIVGVGAGSVSRQVFPLSDRIQRLPNVKDIRLYIQRTTQPGHNFSRKWENEQKEMI